MEVQFEAQKTPSSVIMNILTTLVSPSLSNGFSKGLIDQKVKEKVSLQSSSKNGLNVTPILRQ